MADIHVQPKRNNLWWLWLLIILIVAAVAYYLYINNYFDTGNLNVMSQFNKGSLSGSLPLQLS